MPCNDCIRRPLHLDTSLAGIKVKYRRSWLDLLFLAIGLWTAVQGFPLTGGCWLLRYGF